MAAAQEDDPGALARYLQDQGRLTMVSGESSGDRSSLASAQQTASDERDSLLKYMAQRGVRLPPVMAQAVPIEADEGQGSRFSGRIFRGSIDGCGG